MNKYEYRENEYSKISVLISCQIFIYDAEDNVHYRLIEILFRYQQLYIYEIKTMNCSFARKSLSEDLPDVRSYQGSMVAVSECRWYQWTLETSCEYNVPL